MRVHNPARIGIGNVDFLGGRKTGESREKKPQGENENQQQTGRFTGPESNPSHACERQTRHLYFPFFLVYWH